MRKAVIISTSHLLDKLELRLLEIEGMEGWDSKQLLEIIITYIGKRNAGQSDSISKNVITRIGIDNVYATNEPAKFIKMIYEIVMDFQFSLNILSLKGIELCFEEWVGRDMVVSFSVEERKRLPKKD